MNYRDSSDPLDHWRNDHWTSHPPRVAGYAAEVSLIAALYEMQAAMHPTSLRSAVLKTVMTFLDSCDCDEPEPEAHAPRGHDLRGRTEDAPLDGLDGWTP